MHTLAIAEQGTHVHVESDTLLLSREGRLLRRVRLADLNQILLFGRVEISSGAIAALARRRLDVVFLTTHGHFRARLAGPDSPAAALRLHQLRRALDPAFAAALARTIVAAKIAHQRQILLRAQRRLRDPDLADALTRLRLLVEQCPAQSDLDRLRGLEGRAAALYFAHLGKLLLTHDLPFAGRSRRPPRDPVNACLSFGYALLGNALETQILISGLDPAVGFFHQPAPGRPSLMLDLLEEFRPLVDGLVLRLINRRQLGPLDFEQRVGSDLAEILAEEPAPPAPAPEETPGVFLADVGRRIFLTEFFRRLRERLYYPPRQATFELRDILREQAYHLARVIRGEDPHYVPFLPA